MVSRRVVWKLDRRGEQGTEGLFVQINYHESFTTQRTQTQALDHFIYFTALATYSIYLSLWSPLVTRALDIYFRTVISFIYPGITVCSHDLIQLSALPHNISKHLRYNPPTEDGKYIQEWLKIVVILGRRNYYETLNHWTLVN